MSEVFEPRRLDFETYLVGPVTERIIDADRLVREEWNNGFPNWTMYRAALAGDSYALLALRSWCVAYAIAVAESGTLRKGMPADEMGCLAGWDAFYALINHKWVVAGGDIADVAGVDPKSYRKLRNRVYSHLRASLDEYWIRLQVAVRQVWMMERHQEIGIPVATYGNGRGFDGTNVWQSSTGNYRAFPKPTH